MRTDGRRMLTSTGASTGAGIPILSHGTYLRYATNLINVPSYFLAVEDWGLTEMDLPDVTVTRGSWAESARPCSAHESAMC
jgi:hypothetical protein